jgi:anti-anti-sigma factor
MQTEWFELRGEVDVDHAEQNRALLDAFRDSTATNAVLNLSAVTFMDSTGLRLIAGLAEIATRRGGRLRLLNCQPPVDRLLRVVSFDRICDMERSSTAQQ